MARSGRNPQSPPTQPSGFPSTDEIVFYKLYRDQVVSEDNLVYHRMSWFLVIQTILFVVWATIVKDPENPNQINVTRFMCCFGIIGCFPIAFGVWAAQGEISSLKQNYQSNHPTPGPNPRLPSMIGNADHHWVGKASLYSLIAICFFGWLVILKFFGKL
jgi:hypothetical protein